MPLALSVMTGRRIGERLWEESTPLPLKVGIRGSGTDIHLEEKWPVIAVKAENVKTGR